MTEEQKPGLSGSAKIILACTIILVVFLSGAMYFMWSYLQELSQSPFTIGAERIAKVNDAEDLMCSCHLTGTWKQNTQFYFNSTSMWNDDPAPSKRSYPSFDPNTLNFSS